MFRTVERCRRWSATRVAPLEARVAIEHVLEVPPVRLKTVPGFETAVFPYTTRHPVPAAWGEPLLFGPGSIHVAHTADEWVSIAELNAAAVHYVTLAKALLDPLEQTEEDHGLQLECGYTGSCASSTARRSAARASRRVESSVGSGEFASSMINGISVQPSTRHRSPPSFILRMTRWNIADRLGLEAPVDQLLHDDAVDLLAFAGVRAHVLQPARRELLRIDLALDQPARSGQAEAAEAALDGLRRRRPRRCAARAAAIAVRRRAAPGGSCCRGRSGNRRRSSPACPRTRASARRPPASRRGRCRPCSRRARACASTPRDARAARAAPRLRRKWSDNKAPRLRRSSRRCRYVGAWCVRSSESGPAGRVHYTSIVNQSRAEYESRLTARRVRIAELDRVNLLLSNIRLGIALAAAVLLWMAFVRGSISPLWPIARLVLVCRRGGDSRQAAARVRACAGGGACLCARSGSHR